MPILSGARPRALGVTREGRLRACASSPNCVSSDDPRESHRVAAFALAAPPARAWSALRAAVEALPRTRIVSERGDYLHAECRSPLLGFVDDLELQLRSGEGLVAVRSASRVGWSDLGVNRERIERLRADLARRGVIRSSS